MTDVPRFIDPLDIVSSNREITAAAGEPHHVLKRNELLSAAGAAMQTFAGRWLNKFPYEMAAAYFYALCRDHVFEQGNKRTAVEVALTFLALNGIEVSLDDDQLIRLACAAAQGDIRKEHIAVALEHPSMIDFLAPRERYPYPPEES